MYDLYLHVDMSYDKVHYIHMQPVRRVAPRIPRGQRRASLVARCAGTGC
jgi:hypothetical protein